MKQQARVPLRARSPLQPWDAEACSFAASCVADLWAAAARAQGSLPQQPLAGAKPLRGVRAQRPQCAMRLEP